MLKGRLTRSLDAAVRHPTKNRMKIPITVLQSELVDAHAAAGLRFPFGDVRSILVCVL